MLLSEVDHEEFMKIYSHIEKKYFWQEIIKEWRLLEGFMRDKDLFKIIISSNIQQLQSRMVPLKVGIIIEPRKDSKAKSPKYAIYSRKIKDIKKLDFKAIFKGQEFYLFLLL